MVSFLKSFTTGLYAFSPVSSSYASTSVPVEELAKQFAVSPSSIRRKLTELEKDGLVVRTHGGVKSINDDESGMSFFTRKHTNALEKRLIAIKALKIVHDGDMIFLDSSSTSYFLAEYLSEFPNVTVVTNGVDTLAALAAKKG